MRPLIRNGRLAKPRGWDMGATPIYYILRSTSASVARCCTTAQSSLSPNGAAGELCAFARDVLCDAFAGAHPQTAQYDMPIEAFAVLSADVKSRFIHHPSAPSTTYRGAVQPRVRHRPDLLRRPAPALCQL